MTEVRLVILILSLLTTSGLAVVLGITDPTAPLYFPTRYLVWNLALAWIPVLFAAGFATVRRRGWLIPLGVAWLGFLPNAPYLMTDMVHLTEGVDLWRHVLQFGVVAWTGIILGVVSLNLVHRRLDREFGAAVGWLVVVVSIGLCALGVVIGRFQRWNSWDLLTRPDAVAATTLDWVRAPLANVQSTGVALAIAAFFGLAYLTIWSLTAATDEGRLQQP